MNLGEYVEQLHRELAVAAEAGGKEARALAERLTAPLDSATRLVLLEALSDAAEEITRELAPGSVEVRLRGREPDFVVTSPPAEQSYEDARPVAQQPAAEPAPEPEDGGTSRITLRLPEHLKPRIDEAAAAQGISVNAWLVRAATAALKPEGRTPQAGPRSATQFGQRHTGWVR